MAATDRSADHERIGWVAVCVLTAVVAISWAPLLARPLGANHLGNVAARHGLHVRNLYASGVLGSDFGADWAPYRSEPYAHHPPLLNALDAIVGLLPGDATLQLRVAPYVLALAAIPAAAALLRSLGVNWPATLLAVGAMAATGYFWVYGPIAFDLAFIFASGAATTTLAHDRPGPGRSHVAWFTVLVACTAMASWPGVAFTWAFVAILIGRRRADRLSIVIATGASAGTLLTLVYVVGISGWSALVDQTETRTRGGRSGAERYVEVVGGHLGDLLPIWYLLILVPAVVIGLVDRRTRAVTAVATTFAVAWLVVLNEGAVVHDYWGYLLLIPGLVGMGALLDRVGIGAAMKWGPGTTGVLTAGAVGVVAVTFATMAWGPMADRYLHEPSDAGAVLEAVAPGDTQTTAWSVAFPYGRLLSYEWSLPTRPITDVDVDDLNSSDLVFVDGTELPAWWPTASPPPVVARRGDYFVVTVGALADALEDDPSEL